MRKIKTLGKRCLSDRALLLPKNFINFFKNQKKKSNFFLKGLYSLAQFFVITLSPIALIFLSPIIFFDKALIKFQAYLYKKNFIEEACFLDKSINSLKNLLENSFFFTASKYFEIKQDFVKTVDGHEIVKILLKRKDGKGDKLFVPFSGSDRDVLKLFNKNDSMCEDFLKNCEHDILLFDLPGIGMNKFSKTSKRYGGGFRELNNVGLNLIESCILEDKNKYNKIYLYGWSLGGAIASGVGKALSSIEKTNLDVAVFLDKTFSSTKSMLGSTKNLLSKFFGWSVDNVKNCNETKGSVLVVGDNCVALNENFISMTPNQTLASKLSQSMQSCENNERTVIEDKLQLPSCLGDCNAFDYEGTASHYYHAFKNPQLLQRLLDWLGDKKNMQGIGLSFKGHKCKTKLEKSLNFDLHKEKEKAKCTDIRGVEKLPSSKKSHRIP